MSKPLTLLFGILIGCTFPNFSFSQSKITSPSIFERLSKEAASYKPDTSAVPDDKLTRKIIALREAKGGFNINEAIEFKLGEAKQKNEITEDIYDKANDYFTTGDGKRQLDNAVIWIYRNNFTFKEIKQLTKFYKTSAGRKMSEQLPLIIIESLAAAEKIQEGFKKSSK